MKLGKSRKQSDPVPSKSTKGETLKGVAKAAATKISKAISAVTAKAKQATGKTNTKPADKPVEKTLIRAKAEPVKTRGITKDVQKVAKSAPPAATVEKPKVERKATPKKAEAPPELKRAIVEPKKVSPQPKPSVPEPQKVTPATAPEAKAPAALTILLNAPVRASVPGPVAPKAKPARQPRPVPVEIPAILLEPDHSPSAEPVQTGPGARFALTPEIENVNFSIPTELPESYGTQRIFLAARDPFWLLASWDLDDRQRARYNSESASGAVTIRLRKQDEHGPIHLEIHTKPNSRDWFIYAGEPDTTFVAELGYHGKNTGDWHRISVSRASTTPRDRVTPAPPAPEPQAQITAQPPRFEPVFAIQSPAPESRWVAPRVEQQEPAPRWEHSAAPAPFEAPQPRRSRRIVRASAPQWTPKQAKALDELISLEFRRMQQGSLEIEELQRRTILQTRDEVGAPSSIDLVEETVEEDLTTLLGLARGEAPSSLEAIPAAEAKKGFWFKVNAELIIYGSTEPDAHVSIGGRPIRLRPDGSFSYRFALPDGDYELPVIALSNDGSDGRAAELQFLRGTRYLGEVETHPQDPALKTPAPENL